MSRRYYSEINLHIVWHTKGSSPLLVPRVEAVVHHYIRGRCISTTGGVLPRGRRHRDPRPCCADGGADGPHQRVDRTAQGSSSHDANQRLGGGAKILDLQAGYGVVSFGRKNLPWVVEYVRRQREHHGSGKVIDRLERFEPIPEAAQEDETTAEEGAEARPSTTGSTAARKAP
jgi:putative transposase